MTTCRYRQSWTASGCPRVRSVRGGRSRRSPDGEAGRGWCRSVLGQLEPVWSGPVRSGPARFGPARSGPVQAPLTVRSVIRTRTSPQLRGARRSRAVSSGGCRAPRCGRAGRRTPSPAPVACRSGTASTGSRPPASAVVRPSLTVTRPGEPASVPAATPATFSSSYGWAASPARCDVPWTRTSPPGGEPQGGPASRSARADDGDRPVPDVGGRGESHAVPASGEAAAATWHRRVPLSGFGRDASRRPPPLLRWRDRHPRGPSSGGAPPAPRDRTTAVVPPSGVS